VHAKVLTVDVTLRSLLKQSQNANVELAENVNVNLLLIANVKQKFALNVNHALIANLVLIANHVLNANHFQIVNAHFVVMEKIKKMLKLIQKKSVHSVVMVMMIRNPPTMLK
jgi:hypothetical protein